MKHMTAPAGKFKIETEYIEIIPRPEMEEIKQIRQSLKAYGQKHPIIVDSAYTIVDGYTRFQLLKELKAKIWYEIQDFASKADVLKYVLISNVHRRHLRPFDKVRFFLPLYKLEQKAAKDRLKRIAKHSVIQGTSIDKFSKTIGVSRESAQKSLVILDKGDQKIIKGVTKGSISLTQAYKALVRKESLDERKHHYEIKCKDMDTGITKKYEKHISERLFDSLTQYIATL